MPPTPKPIQFHVGILINEANYVTNTLSRQQSVIVENPPSVLLCISIEAMLNSSLKALFAATDV
jgi:hypothetical protein